MSHEFVRNWFLNPVLCLMNRLWKHQIVIDVFGYSFVVEKHTYVKTLTLSKHLCSSLLNFLTFSHSHSFSFSSTESSRRHSEESTRSLNAPIERQPTPQVSSISSGVSIGKQRSTSLVNIKNRQAYESDSFLNDIEESPQKSKFYMRRASMQAEKVNDFVIFLRENSSTITNNVTRNVGNTFRMSVSRLAIGKLCYQS